MCMQENQICFLLSRDEYVHFSVAYRKLTRPLRSYCCMMAGLLLLAAGVACTLYGQHLPLSPLMVSTAMTGGALLMLYSICAPMYAAAIAGREYDNNRILQAAKHYTFTDDFMELTEGDGFMRLPLSMCTAKYRVTGEDGGFILSFEDVYLFMLPDRVLTAAQKQYFSDLKVPV